MTLKEYYKLTKGSYTSTNSVLHILHTDDVKFHHIVFKEQVLKWIKKDATEFEINNDVFGLMAKVNKMVKHESCPNNIRNRFYSFKHRLIRELVFCNMADKIVYESDNLYKFVFGPYEFHQPKSNYPQLPNGYVIEHEDYVNKHEAIEFYMDVYKEAAIAMVYKIYQLKYGK